MILQMVLLGADMVYFFDKKGGIRVRIFSLKDYIKKDKLLFYKDGYIIFASAF